MTQEDINELQWKSLPEWRKRQLGSESDDTLIRYNKELEQKLAKAMEALEYIRRISKVGGGL